MKQKLKTIGMLAVFYFAASFVVRAGFSKATLLDGNYTETIGDYTWKYSVIHGCVGIGERDEEGNWSWDRAVEPEPTGELVIPDTIAGYRVTALGNHVFDGCSGLTSVTIPSNVVEMGEGAFYNCENLKSVVLPPNLREIPYDAFSECHSLESVDIPDSVRTIGDWAFNGCSALTRITIPTNVTSIGEGAFSSCEGLVSLKIPSSVTSIGGCSLDCGGNLRRIMFEGTPPSVSDDQRLCDAINQEVTLRYNAAYEAEWLAALAGCDFKDAASYDPEVALPWPDDHNYTEEVDGYTWIFSIVAGEAEIGAKEWDGNPRWGQSAVSPKPAGELVIPQKLGGCPVTCIGSHAFEECYDLTHVTVPYCVTNIGESAFNCWSGSLNGVDFEGAPPNGLSSVGIEPDVAIRYNVVHETEWLRVIEECGFVNVTAYDPDALPDGSNYTEEVDGYTWMFSIRNGEAEIVNDSGHAAVSPTPTGELLIPAILGRCPVISIGCYSFEACSGLTSVIIPEGVTSIESCAFSGCTCLTNVSISSSVVSIDFQAFGSCTALMSFVVDEDNPAYKSENGLLLTKDGKTLVRGINCNVTIPEGVTSIGICAFWGCSGLTSVTIPDGVTYIGSNAFDGCGGLGDGVVVVDGCVVGVNGDCPSSVILPEGTRLIADNAFYGCDGLTSITIPLGVSSIGSYAFWGCDSLASIELPSTLVSIGMVAFADCTCLTNVSIPSSVVSIGDCPFCGCTALMSFVVDEDNPAYKSENGLLLTKDGRTLVQGINGDVTIPEGVTQIGWNAFNSCFGLTNLTIPASVESIDYAFYGCSGLTNVVIPSGVTYIASGAFSGCSGIMSFDVDDDNPNYKSENGLLLSKDGKTLVQGVNGDVLIPDGVTSIGERAFFDFGGLTSVTIPSSVTSIGSDAFYCCSGLTRVVIPSSVTSIGQMAFAGCSMLTAFVVDDENPSYKSEDGLLLSKDGTTLVCVIGGDVTIPASVVIIDEYAFYCCSGLTSIDFEGAPLSTSGFLWVDRDIAIRYNAEYSDEWLPVIEEYGFTNATAYIPSDGGPYAETVTGVEWTFTVTNGTVCVTGVQKDVVGAVTIPATLGGRAVTEIAANAMNGCSQLTSVTIPDSVTKIGSEAFSDCPRLADVTFTGDTVSSMASDAFARCNWDLVVHVPNDWTGRSSSLFGHTVVRDGATDSQYVYLTVTNVVVQYVLNSVKPEIAVPVSGDTGFVIVITEVKSSGAVSVPSEWKDNYPSFTATYGSDMGKALMMKTGKKDGAGNEMLVWQDFVAGTDPTDENDKFTASITIVDGVPVVSYTPELTPDQTALRTYKTFGKKQLQDTDWTDITDLDGEARKPYNFFKVTVEMK